MRILILGGDGYLGWATAMHFSKRGHEVHTIDNYLRRRAHKEAGTDSLTPILDSLPARAKVWNEVSGKDRAAVMISRTCKACSGVTSWYWRANKAPASPVSIPEITNATIL